MNFKLSGAIQQNEQSFKPGEEKALIAILSDEQKADFIERGLLVPVMVEGAPLEEATIGLSDVDPAEIAASYISSTFGIQPISGESAADFLNVLITDLRNRQRAQEELDALEYILSSYTNGDVDELPKVTLERIVSQWKANEDAATKLADAKTAASTAKSEATRTRTENDKLKKDIEDLQGKLAEALKPKTDS